MSKTRTRGRGHDEPWRWGRCPSVMRVDVVSHTQPMPVTCRSALNRTRLVRWPVPRWHCTCADSQRLLTSHIAGGNSVTPGGSLAVSPERRERPTQPPPRGVATTETCQWRDEQKRHSPSVAPVATVVGVVTVLPRPAVAGGDPPRSSAACAATSPPRGRTVRRANHDRHESSTAPSNSHRRQARHVRVISGGKTQHLERANRGM